MRLLKSIALSLTLAVASSPAFAVPCTVVVSALSVPGCYFFPPNNPVSGKTYTLAFSVNKSATLTIQGQENFPVPNGDPLTKVSLTGFGATGSYSLFPGYGKPDSQFAGIWHVLAGHTYDLILTFTTANPIKISGTIAAAAVPLPPAIALFGGVLAGMAFLARRKKLRQPRVIG